MPSRLLRRASRQSYCTMQSSFLHTHNIAVLITLVVDLGISWPRELDEVSRLTEYAVETRYPGAVDPITDEEYRHAVAMAEKVYFWAERSVTA
jgi:HEPN domain-containing protein